MIGSKQKNVGHREPFVIAIAVGGILIACAIAGAWTWQASTLQHAASQQEDGQRALPQNPAFDSAAH